MTKAPSAPDSCSNDSNEQHGTQTPEEVKKQQIGRSTLFGILAMQMSVFCFVTTDTLTKLSSSTMPGGELVAIRCVFAVIFICVICLFTGQFRHFKLVFKPIVILRSLMETAASLFGVFAVLHLPIANVTAILLTIPLATAAGAALVLHEHVGIRRWLTIFLGFAGVVIIIRPGLEGFSFFSLFALCAVFSASTRDLASRYLPRDSALWIVTLATIGYTMIASFIFGLTETWVMPEPQMVLYLLGASIFLTLGHFVVVIAMNSGEVAVVTSFRYVSILFALIYGYLLWGEIPDALTWLGIALILTAGLYMIYRERKLAKERAARQKALLAQAQA